MKNFFKKVRVTIQSIVQWIKQPEILRNIINISACLIASSGIKIPESLIITLVDMF